LWRKNRQFNITQLPVKNCFYFFGVYLDLERVRHWWERIYWSGWIEGNFNLNQWKLV